MAGRGRAWRRGETFALDAREMAAFVAAVERGATIAAAAREAGVAVSTVYERRRTFPPFAAAWAEAAAKSARPMLVMGTKGRRLVLKKGRAVQFDRKRKQAVLDHFAGSGNLEAAAAAAGISLSPVYRALNNDAAFAEGFEAALAIGYRLLEAEALRQQREAQQAYKISPKRDPEAAALSFERTMQLLREYNRGGGRIGRRAARQGDPDKRMTFDEAMELLEKRLRHFGVEIEEDAEGAEAGPGAGEETPPDGGEDSGA